jgi:hypothetical protein
MPTAKRLRDFVFYVAITSAVIFVAIGGAILSGENGLSFLKWLELAVFTSALYGYWIAENRTNLRKQSFWVITLSAFLVHIVGCTFALVDLEWFKPIWLSILTIGELVALIQLRAWFLRSRV